MNSVSETLKQLCKEYDAMIVAQIHVDSATQEKIAELNRQMNISVTK